MKERRKPKRSDLDVKALRELLDSGAVGEVTLHQDMEEITKWVEDEEAAIEDWREFTAGVSWHVEWGFKKNRPSQGPAKVQGKDDALRPGPGVAYLDGDQPEGARVVCLGRVVWLLRRVFVSKPTCVRQAFRHRRRTLLKVSGHRPGWRRGF